MQDHPTVDSMEEIFLSPPPQVSHFCLGRERARIRDLILSLDTPREGRGRASMWHGSIPHTPEDLVVAPLLGKSCDVLGEGSCESVRGEMSEEEGQALSKVDS